VRLFAILALLASAAFAQETANFQPQYWLGAGSSYNYYAAPPAHAGWISFAAKVADRTYSFSTIDMTQTQAAIRTGVARILSQSGNVSLLALGDAGLTTVNGVALGSFSGGGILLYDLGAFSQRLQHVYATGALRVIGTGGSSVQPVFEIGLSFSLGK
jgi:hypothetical protein